VGVLAAALGFGVVADLLLREPSYGVNILLWALAFLAALFAMRQHARDLRRLSARSGVALLRGSEACGRPGLPPAFSRPSCSHAHASSGR